MDIWTILFAHSVLLLAIYVYIKVLGKFVNRFVKKSMLRRGGTQTTIEAKVSYAKETQPEIDLHILRPKDKFFENNLDHNEIVNFVASGRIYGNIIVVLAILFFAVVNTLNAHGIGNPDKKSIGDSIHKKFCDYEARSRSLVA